MQPTSEQILMRDNLVRLLGDGVARHRATAAAWPAVDRQLWSQCCEAGWPALLLPEDAAGWGCSPADMVMLIEGSSRHLPPAPMAQTLVVAPVLARCRSEASRTLLNQVLAGEAIALIAQADPFPLPKGASFVAHDAHWADMILCAEGTGPSFRLVAVRAAELDPRSALRRTVDDGAQLVFAAPRGTVLGLGHGVEIETAFTTASNLIRLGAAAGLVGLARHSLVLTIDYLKTRKQFGQPIGSFQALQHRAASMHVACVAAWALVCEAAMSIGGPMEQAACAMAKSKASAAARQVLNECVQMHGAIGFSDEHVLAVYFRRVISLASSFGCSDACLAELSDQVDARFPAGGSERDRPPAASSSRMMAG
ncbi:acyl-CoA dehydrogenase family protein (plasmid) [Bosea vestrisii]|uniref:acyl-CoA dehydrogenase family protein n=1 Tax=Bosea vestrisii TaxID=151416 RepID=UPI0024DF4BA3|nr:acyl-CoA dehydrogenase family protein [Bosea vestrisii]WID99977.1 acyl-CoA dehydrogenase family protein [Bosea vestrisii]